VQEEKPLEWAEYVFKMKSHATNGDLKEFCYIPGMCVVSHQMYVLAAIWNHPFNVNCILQDWLCQMGIPTLERFFYTNMHLIIVPDMCAITFEMMK
jgi:hypothetical protein